MSESLRDLCASQADLRNQRARLQKELNLLDSQLDKETTIYNCGDVIRVVLFRGEVLLRACRETVLSDLDSEKLRGLADTLHRVACWVGEEK